MVARPFGHPHARHHTALTTDADWGTTAIADTPAVDHRLAMARLASGVSVVSTRDSMGRDCGLTVTSLVSLSKYTARRRGCREVNDFSDFGPKRGTASGVLYFPDGVASPECRRFEVTAAGWYLVAVGEVVGLPIDCHGEHPLVYHQRAYRDFVSDLAPL